MNTHGDSVPGNKIIKKNAENITIGKFYDDIRRLIDEARSSVAIAINTTMTMLYWQIGKRINDKILEGERAEYGKKIVSTLSRQLTNEYGSGFSSKNLRHMMKFADVFPLSQEGLGEIGERRVKRVERKPFGRKA